MNIRIEIVEAHGSVARFAECAASEEECIRDLAGRMAQQLEIEAEELMLDLGVGDIRFDQNARVGECIKHGNHWLHRRVCVDLRFESESIVHHFAPKSTWARVHRWGCHHFHIAGDACANLELREGSPTGPALNENAELGVFAGCKTVWLVKPGPEVNGGTKG